MALNPEIASSGTPINLPHEVWAFSKNNVKFSVESGNGYPGQGGNYYGSGVVYLSSWRCILVFVPGNHVCRAIEIPLHGVKEHKLNQPIFGSNSVSGQVEPLPGRGLHSVAKFKLTFESGGGPEFYQMFSPYVGHAQRSGPPQESMSSTTTPPPQPQVAQPLPGDRYMWGGFAAPPVVMPMSSAYGAPQASPVVYAVHPGAGGYGAPTATPVPYTAYPASDPQSYAYDPNQPVSTTPSQSQGQQAYIDPNDPTKIYVQTASTDTQEQQQQPPSQPLSQPPSQPPSQPLPGYNTQPPPAYPPVPQVYRGPSAQELGGYEVHSMSSNAPTGGSGQLRQRHPSSTGQIN
eukprot:GFYU01002159.1.p1 GENE.GFYU01002159.1~~GFYU01002159.1.p1  ORF type:complete len:346 (-),score=43.74 GFYU01002159.1:166-1203(-)